MSFNKIFVVGNLGKDPEAVVNNSGSAVTKFSVATEDKQKSPTTGNWEPHTQWFNITVFGKQAENALQYLSKGSSVFVEGRLTLREYTTKAGKSGVNLEVAATDLKFLGKNDKAKGVGASSSNLSNGQQNVAGDDVDSEDIPF